MIRVKIQEMKKFWVKIMKSLLKKVKSSSETSLVVHSSTSLETSSSTLYAHILNSLNGVIVNIDGKPVMKLF